MQEAANKQKRMADDMDINLEVFNLETDFFGDLQMPLTCPLASLRITFPRRSAGKCY